MKNYLTPALAALASAAFCLCLAVGGCRRTGPSPACAAISESSALAVPAAMAGEPGASREIGERSDVIGRLEKPAVVRATLFHAGEAVGREGDVRLAPGTWLVPGPVIAMPAPEEK